jgi:hypothetical protein
MVHNQLILLKLFFLRSFIETPPDGGIRKGALTQEQAGCKLAAWLEAKAGKVDAKRRFD